jgi:hypothetical protein
VIKISRVADSTIKGFLYQFNLTLNELLISDDDTIIQVEGVIEDVDIIKNDRIVAIQCKYHEEQDSYTLSKMYKPILQMLRTHISSDDIQIDYVLYAYFPTEIKRNIKLSEDDMLSILCTENLDYISKYICKISPPSIPEVFEISKKERKSQVDKKALKDYYEANPLEINDKIRLFIEERLTISFADSFETVEQSAKDKLIHTGIDDKDVEEIFYPNAIHKIAQLSTNSDDKTRKIRRRNFLQELLSVKKTAISRWTRELKNYKQLITSRRNQISTNLNQNNRKRYFLINVNNIENLFDDIVMFIKDYTEIYCHKPKLHDPALICLSSSDDRIADIAARLYKKSVEVEIGYVGCTFFPERLMREPERKVNDNWMQFKMRLCSENEETINTINDNKPDDLFIINDRIDDRYDLQDINVEYLDVKTINELKFILKMIKEVPVIE